MTRLHWAFLAIGTLVMTDIFTPSAAVAQGRRGPLARQAAANSVLNQQLLGGRGNAGSTTSTSSTLQSMAPLGYPTQRNASTTSNTSSQQSTNGSMCSGSSSQNQAGLQALNKFTTDLTAVVSNGELTAQQAIALYQDVAAVLEARRNRQSALSTLQSDLQALQSVTTLAAGDLQTLTTDITTILQTNRSSHSMTSYGGGR